MTEKIFIDDIELVCKSEWIDFDVLNGATVLVSGATGLIGSAMVRTLLGLETILSQPPEVIALVRDKTKAEAMFSDTKRKRLKIIVGDICSSLVIDEKIDYIVHAASQTASKAFVSEPVDTIRTSIDGTVNMLELAREKAVKGFIYLSSMEVYGSPNTDEKIREDHSTNLNSMHVRTSYPESKRMCEALCTAYCAQYAVPAKVIRLTQTFGPGVKYNDGRVFAEFARCALEKKDIVLHTKGETKRCYLYTADAVTAILTVLLHGTAGEAYNAANEDAYCSIYEMAQMVAHNCANDEIKVRIEIADESSFGYAPVLKMNLDAGKLKKLGWKAKMGIEDMLQCLCTYMLSLKK